MAIYHLRFKAMSRSEGYHAVNSAAYRRGIEMVSHDGEIFNWTHKKEEVIHSDILIPEGSAGWVEELVILEKAIPGRGSEKLWNIVELTEKRKDSQLHYEIDAALPKELDNEQHIELVQQFAKEHLTKRGLIVDYSIHYIAGNPHVHIACTTREIAENGFGCKVIEWKQKSFLFAIREGWATASNYALTKAGLDISISHKSYEAQGLDLKATIHEGAARHIGAEGNLIFKHNDTVRQINFEKILSSPELLFKKVALERETFTRADLMAEFMRHAPTGKDFTPQIRTQMLQAIDLVTPVIGMTKDKLVIDLDSTEKTTDHDIIQKIFVNLNTTKSVFTEYDLARAANVATNSVEEFSKVYEELKTSTKLINLGPGDDGKIRFTTYEAFEIENTIQDIAEALNAKHGHQVTNQIANKYAKQFKLNQEQTVALKHILTGNDLTAIVGYAGTGKSYLLGCAKKAWEHAGYNVQGIALAGIAAEGLEEGAKIPSRTIESLRIAIKLGFVTLSNKDIIVMDEAGMVDNLAFVDVLTYVKQANAKLVIVGDDAQLAPIGPGAAFRAIIERIGCAVLGNVVRQKEAWQRQATMEFAKNLTEDALARYEEKNCVRLLDNTTLAKQQLINDWLVTIETGKAINQCLILAFENNDVNELNKLAREKLIQTNKLAAEAINFATKKNIKEFRIGERIIFLENNSRVGVKNGRRGMVVGFEHDALQIHLDGDGEKIITIHSENYNNIDYGYASTVHKTQGMTVLDSFVLAVGHWSKNLTYVAMSRHKENAYIYGGKDLFATVEQLKKHMSRWSIKDAVLDFPIQFMQRRGLLADGLTDSFAAHWQDKLSNFFEIVEKYVSPDTYYHKLSVETKMLEIIERRRQAQIVGTDYIKARSNARDAYLALEKVGVHLGMTEALENTALFEKLQGHPALEFYQHARDLRNEIAYKIWHNKDALARALELNAINLEHVEKYAKQHKYASTVKSYLEHVKSGKTIWQDKLAWAIQNDIKAHYKYLKELGVDTRLLREQAVQHEVRSKLKELSSELKEAIRAYKIYQIAGKRAADAWQIISSNSDSGHKTIRSMFVYANSLITLRNQAAYALVQKPNYKQALELLNIKPIDSTSSPTPSKEEEWQQQKFKKLHDYVDKHAALLLVKSFLAETRVRQEKIAVEICKDPKIYHGAICANTNDFQNLWKEIRQLAEFNRAHEFKLQLPWDQRGCFDEVQKYVVANKSLGLSLVEITESKKIINPLPVEVMEQIAEYGKSREALAYKINNNLEAYKPTLDFFKVDPNKISSLALKEEARLRVLEFKQNVGNIEHKAKLAQVITADPQLHYWAAKDLGLNFLKFYPYAKYADKLDKLAGLPLAEQADFKLVDRYKQLVRKAGKYWTTQTKENDSVINWTAVRQGQLINASRDALASQIYNDLDRFSDIQHLVGGKFDKLEQHAQGHLRRKDEVTNYLTERAQLIEITEKVASKNQNLPDSYKQAWKNNIKTGERFNWQAEKYNAVLKELNTSATDFGWYTTTAANETLKSPDPIQPKYYDLDRVNHYLALNAREFAIQLLGQPTNRSNGQQLYFGSKNGSLGLAIQGDKIGLWHDFASGEGGNLIHLAQRELGLNFKEAVAYCANQAVMLSSTEVYHKKVFEYKVKEEQVSFSEEQLKKIALAKKLAESGRPIANTPAEKYLASRHIDRFNSTDIKHVWAYEPEHKKTEEALLCIARNASGEIQSTQVIYISSTGHKIKELDAAKRTYGPIKAASCLVNTGKDKETIYIAEGPETALSIAQADPSLTVYATFGVSNFGKVPLPSETKKVVICADNDGENAQSYKNTMNAAQLLLERGVEVSITKPRYEGQDFNDTLKHFGPNGVRDLIKNSFVEIKLDAQNNALETNKPKPVTIAEEFIDNRQEIVRLKQENKSPEEERELKFRRELELKLAHKIKNDPVQIELLQTKGYTKELEVAHANYQQQIAMAQEKGINRTRD